VVVPSRVVVDILVVEEDEDTFLMEPDFLDNSYIPSHTNVLVAAKQYQLLLNKSGDT
jgi:hypothetical protein